MKGSAIGNEHPSDVLQEVNRLLIDDNETGMFVTVFYCIVNPNSGRITYSNGGHNPPLVVKPDGSSMFLTIDSGVALGMFGDIEFKTEYYSLQPNDRVVFYTDGITEAMNDREELFGNNRLMQVVKENRDLNIEYFNQAIVNSVSEFSQGVPQTDDITCISLHYDGPK